MNRYLKATILIVALTALAQTHAGDIFDFGEKAPEWQDAPKNTQLGQEALSHLGVLSHGRLIFNSRLRYEYAGQTGRGSSNAVTWRNRIGYETPKWYGLYGLAEYEYNWAINSGDFPSTPPQAGASGKTIIADPNNSQINQLFLGYSNFNSDVKGGRQVINLDNQRFVGAVAWRQNDQTFDSARFTTKILKDTWFSYAYVWQVNRIFGESETPNNNLRRFNSQSHLVNFHYTGLPVGKLGSYFYYLDLGGTAGTPSSTAAISGNTVGLFYTGAVKFDEDWSMPFHAEYAYQFANGTSGQPDFSMNYLHFKLGGKYQKYQAGFGFESLGGNGAPAGAGGRAFQTPLATLHKFNGWADRFLTTPTAGLRDYYIYYGAGLPYGFKLNGAFHYFTESNTAKQYGTEFDIGLGYKINENTTALIKFAQYWGSSNPGSGVTGGPLSADSTRVWLQVDFKL